MEFIDVKKLNELKDSGTKLLVDITASWCGPCKTLVPRLEKIEPDYSNVTFVKMDAEQNRDFLIGMDVNAVPTVIIYNGHKMINRFAGVQSESTYRDVLNTL